MKKILFPLLATASMSQIALAETEKPNIVFLLIDDLGWGELAPYGNTFNETPHITQMAQEGVTFTNAYAAGSVSSPTRACFYTGQYAPRHGICDFLPENSKNYLDPAKHVTVNEALKEAGYYTGMTGKWHLDTDFAENKGGPGKHGYDWVFGTETKYIAGGDYFYPYDKISTITTGIPNEFLTDRLCNEALNFIEEHKESPFFLSIQLYSVHMTLEAPADLVTKYKQKYDAKYGAGKSAYFDSSSPVHAGAPDNPYMAGMLEKIDNNVGNIIQKLKDLGIDDHTIFIVTSDNGGDAPVANNGGLKECKTWLYEGGIRVPLIIRYPGRCTENTTCDTPVSTIDFYPTFLELAGNAPTNQLLDGTSILPLLKANGHLDRDELYWYYPAGNSDWNPRKASALRKGDYKLIYRFALAPDRYELYNLKNDPEEKNNLVTSNPQKLNELKEKCKK
jgi:arylsulfatase A-like enzyme